MKGFLTADHRSMSHDTQMGYLLAMMNGDVTNPISPWALVWRCRLCLWEHYQVKWLDARFVVPTSCFVSNCV